MPITAIEVSSVCDMACSLSWAPLASFARWRGRSTARPFPLRTFGPEGKGTAWSYVVCSRKTMDRYLILHSHNQSIIIALDVHDCRRVVSVQTTSGPQLVALPENPYAPRNPEESSNANAACVAARFSQSVSVCWS